MFDKAFKKTESRERGQTVIETVLMLLVLFIILFMITEFGRAWYVKNSLNNAARIGARYAAVTPDILAKKQEVEDYVKKQPGVPSNAEVYTNLTGGAVTVGVSAVVNFVPLALGLGDAVNIPSEASMRYER